MSGEGYLPNDPFMPDPDDEALATYYPPIPRFGMPGKTSPLGVTATEAALQAEFDRRLYGIGAVHLDGQGGARRISPFELYQPMEERPEPREWR